MGIKAIILVILITFTVVVTTGITTNTIIDTEKRETKNQSLIVHGMNE